MDVIFYLSFICLCVLHAPSAVANNNIQKTDLCGPSEHSCRDGTCVNADRVCDGRADCADDSDERGCRLNKASYIVTIEGPLISSNNSICRKNQWQCRDGTCIAFDYICNRVLDCPDGSDEGIVLCQTTQPISSIVVVSSGGQPKVQLGMQPSQSWPEPPGQTWQSELPQEPESTWSVESEKPETSGSSGHDENSLRSCKLIPHPSVKYNCVDSNGRPRECTNLEPAGVDVAPECADLYYSPVTLTTMRCIDGYWDYIARCTPECGKLSSLNEGTPFEEQRLTWHTAIYRKNTQPYQRACAGSLITNTAVISAARCFWSDPAMMVLPASEFAVAVGKTYEQWDVSDGSQTSDVKNILLSPNFRGKNANNQDDIAIVVLTDSIVYNTAVGPVCVDSNTNFDRKQLQPGNIGKVAGWWTKESSAVQIRDMPYVAIESCISNTSDMNRKYITSDKICAGDQSSSNLCKPDIGTGLAFVYKVKSVYKYYLRGVASMQLNNNDCNDMSHATFTQVLKHKSFIRQHWDELQVDRSVPTLSTKPLETKCVLPPPPHHGTYSVNTEWVGDGTYQLVTLTVTCHPGYGVIGDSSIKCYNGIWPDKVPQCIQMCAVPFHPSVEYSCLSSAQEGSQGCTRACSEHEPPDTVVNPRCREPHYYSTTPLPFMRCERGGRWNYIARCKPDCGRPTPKGQELAVGGENARRGELPWHVGIYDKTKKPFLQICGGSLISNDVIISAAHCFWQGRSPLPESQFSVAVGKLYRPWNDPVDDAQKSDVKQIHIPPRFRGLDSNFQDDIALVVVSHPFEYRSFVRPVCLSFDTNFEKQQLQTINKGKVAGWGLISANGKASPTLQVLELPYVDVNTCLDNSPSVFVQYITSDKICAGTRQTNSALCHGDSGGGLVFPAAEGHIERYYLRGVVSTAPSDENYYCNTAAYTAFTRIQQHQDFILPYLTDL